MPGKLSVLALSWGLAASRRLLDLAHLTQQALEETALRTFDDAQLQALTMACFERFPTRQTTLFPWERSWFARDLPAAPSRLLLGGAGSGRELLALRELGYEVCAFDPLPPSSADILHLDYQGWLAPRNRAQLAATVAVKAHAPYDAVILGWGSFNHLPNPVIRLQVLQAARQQCTGPVLLSFWEREEDAPDAYSFGRRLGARFIRWTGGGRRQRLPGEHILAHTGYSHAFSPLELQGLAQAAGYRLQRFPTPYPHATLWPERDANRSWRPPQLTVTKCFVGSGGERP